MIYWIGNSENWDKPRHSRAGNFLQERGSDRGQAYIFPLVEESVLEVAFSPLYEGFKRLSQFAALCCTSRFTLRSNLPRELNPKWREVPFPFRDGVVVKAPASCQNQGIGFAFPNQYSRRLDEYDRSTSTLSIIEEYLSGPQYEADGVVIGGKVHLLEWTLQEGENGKIVNYIPLSYRSMAEAPTEVIKEVVKALGLDNCPFCFEMKRTTDENGQWKIIDAHARLGEDRRLWTDQAALFSRIDKIISGVPQPSPQS